MRVRTYWVPGFFNEANPESSTRYIGTSRSTSKLFRPRVTASILAAWTSGPPLGTIPDWRNGLLAALSMATIERQSEDSK